MTVLTIDNNVDVTSISPQIPLHDKVNFIHVWCHVFTETHHSVTRSLVGGATHSIVISGMSNAIFSCHTLMLYIII